VLAAEITRDSGTDGINIRLCHGYLGSQILRPYNTRKWKYGGKWENRRQFAFDLYERIKKAVPDKDLLIGSKISVWESFPGGFGTAEPDTPVINLTEPIDLKKVLRSEAPSISYNLQADPRLPSVSPKQIRIIRILLTCTSILPRYFAII
jgi:2,4-dienoyl-CoA reductase-like NADH-dependent reductase (Old Yellow Enzyme family)